MKRRNSLALASVTAMAAGVLVALPVQAATCVSPAECSTIVTFTVTSGNLDVTVPDGPVSLTNFTTPPTYLYAYGQLGDIVVSDARASGTPDWTATVTSTSFVNPPPPASPVSTIPNTAVYYFSGDAVAPSPHGLGVFTPGQPGTFTAPSAANATPPSGTAIGTGITAFSHAGGTGVNDVTWNPNLVVYVDGGTAGAYQGTISHSVS